MNKERLEWVMSGLNQYKLTKNEDQFVNSAVEDFNREQCANRTPGRKTGKALQGEIAIETQ